MQVLFTEPKGVVGKGIAQEFFGLLVKFLNEIMTTKMNKYFVSMTKTIEEDYDFPVFAGITSSRNIIAEGLDTTKDKLLFKYFLN
jgi:hypothetical protein